MSKNPDLDAILKAFNRIPKATRQPINKALHKGADELTGRMDYLAPQDEGALRRSIKKTELNEFAVQVSAGDETTEVEVRKGSGVTVNNALLQEYGGTDREAQPYFWPSVNTLKKRVRRRVDRAIGKSVKDTWGKS